MNKILIGLGAAAVFSAVCVYGIAIAQPSKKSVAETPAPAISEAMVSEAHDRWCEGLIAISSAHKEGADYKQAAENMLNDVYMFQDNKILFKPTLTHGDQTFRFDRDAVLSYFIGGNKNYTQDSGFALKNWASCRHKSARSVVEGDIAISMGNIWLTDHSANEVKVDKTFVFKRGPDNKLYFITHMSALPYVPPQE
ncbi:MAG: hypothetical protein ACK4PK_02495 [Alphaproteobacteria bacterium]